MEGQARPAGRYGLLREGGRLVLCVQEEECPVVDAALVGALGDAQSWPDPLR